MSQPIGSTNTAVALRNPWAVVPSLGNLDAYITAVNRMPLLTLEEEQEYARRFKEEQDLEAASKLVLSHLRLVISIARGYLGYGLPHADAVRRAGGQAGDADREPAQGAAFSPALPAAADRSLFRAAGAAERAVTAPAAEGAVAAQPRSPRQSRFLTNTPAIHQKKHLPQ